MVRKQIVLPDDVDRRLRRLAEQRGASQSAVIADAVRALPEPQDQLAQMLAFSSSIEGGPADLSEEVDRVLYG